MRSNLRVRQVWVRDLPIGGGAPISVQSMCSVPTGDVEATVAQAERLREAGADIVRVAVDNARDAEALREVRARTQARLAVDLQENYTLAEQVAPYVDKIRYNPGHLHHRDRGRSSEDKARWIARVAADHGCAVRIGVNCGSVAPEFAERYADDPIEALVASAVHHACVLEEAGFHNYVVSLKDSDPEKVVEANRRFRERMPHVPLHLGVTEAGLLPEAGIKTRIAFEQLVPAGIGETLRASFTLPSERKHEEVLFVRQMLADMEAGRYRSVPPLPAGLNIIACPSCSRVENEAFVELAERVRERTAYAREANVTIAVMGCRVNGPGETDDADLGVWCGPTRVTLKRKQRVLGTYGYDEVLDALDAALREVIAGREPVGRV